MFGTVGVKPAWLVLECPTCPVAVTEGRPAPTSAHRPSSRLQPVREKWHIASQGVGGAAGVGLGRSICTSDFYVNWSWCHIWGLRWKWSYVCSLKGDTSTSLKWAINSDSD